MSVDYMDDELEAFEVLDPLTEMQRIAHRDGVTIPDLETVAALWRSIMDEALYARGNAGLGVHERARRADRLFGVAIARGKDAGIVLSIGANRRDGMISWEMLTPNANARLYARRYADVNATDFEAALSECRARGTMSRPAVAAALDPTFVPRDKPGPDRRGVTPRDEFHNKTRRVDRDRIIEETVVTLEGLAMGLELIDDDYGNVDPDTRDTWLGRLAEPLAAINRMRKGLRG